jgi:hypothetical protein
MRCDRQVGLVREKLLRGWGVIARWTMREPPDGQRNRKTCPNVCEITE